MRKRRPGPRWGKGWGEGCRKGKEAAPGSLRASRGPSASAGWVECLAPEPCCLSLLGVCQSLEAAVARAELQALLLGGRASRGGGASGRGGSGASGRGRGSSGGRAPESGGCRFPLQVRGGAWPLLPPPPPPLPPLSKTNRAVAGAAAAGDPAGKSLGRGLTSTASAPRTAQRPCPGPRRRTTHLPTGARARGVRISTADSARAPVRRRQPTCSPNQHRGQPPSTGPPAG